ncbi:MAG: Biotin operon repressor / Biotin-protein ligase [Myxococcaceae bacterium]|jgi:BirA family biotin operon repressor/biotin-[acetyl-CoA-carboxylase] ligase|nr:Biotin operon repressor / Biotin-protein ligase [Myxococcaceae bacterium]MEA2746837.1 BirA family transcriptional regulator [Myxococcales bacterium]
MIARRASPDLARAAEAIAARGSRLGVPLVIADETTSTNDDAKHGARDGAPHGAVWIAESQTSGRGRQGRAWLSPRGENLLFSVLLRLRCAPSRVPPVSLVCGLAVRDAVARALGGAPGSDADVVVKWPNDVLVRSPRDGVLRKVAGVLVESALSGAKVEYVVVGIGINVLTRALPEEVAAFATSIALERDARGAAGAGELDRAEVLADVLAQLDRDVEHVAHKGLGLVHARLTRHDALAGKHVESVADDGSPGDLRGMAAGIDLDGRLLVRAADGTITRVASGEMRVRATA